MAKEPKMNAVTKASDLRRRAWNDANRQGAVPPVAQDLDHGPTGEAALARKSEVVTIEGRARGSVATERITVRRYRDECQLDALNTRGQLSDRLWRAGMLFRGAWLVSVQLSRVCATYAPTSGGGRGDDVPVRRIEARKRIDDALEALSVPRYQNAVVGVCGMDEACSGRLRALQEALDVLCRHYQVAPDYCREATRRR